MALRILIVNLLCFLFLQHSYSQPPRIAVFDLDSMVHALPEFKAVDSLINLFADSAMAEYKALQSEYTKIDNMLIGDIHDMRFMDSISKRRQQVAFSLIYWNNIIEQKTSDKIRTWSKPLYEKVNTAFKKVIENKSYDLILKPSLIEIGSTIENLFLDVARELHLRSLPNNLFYVETPTVH
jgi:Skp family chaperone for outer membrane proteins